MGLIIFLKQRQTAQWPETEKHSWQSDLKLRCETRDGYREAISFQSSSISGYTSNHIYLQISNRAGNKCRDFQGPKWNGVHIYMHMPLTDRDQILTGRVWCLESSWSFNGVHLFNLFIHYMQPIHTICRDDLLANGWWLVYDGR